MDIEEPEPAAVARFCSILAGKQKQLFRLGGASALILAAFWLVLFPNFLSREPLPIDEIEVTGFETAKLDGASYEDLQAARFKEQSEGPQFALGGYYGTRAEFKLDSIPDRGLAIIVFGGAANARHFVNGQPLPFAGSMSVDTPTYHRLQPSVEQVPSGYLVLGRNRVETIHVQDAPARDIPLWPPLVGEFGQVSEATAWRLFLLNDFLTISIIVGFVLALFLAVITFKAKDRLLPFWLFLLTLSWSTHSLFYRWAEMPLHGHERVGFYALSLLLMSACWPIYVDAWSERPKRWLRNAILAVLAIASIAVLLLISDLGGVRGWSNAEIILDRFGLAMMILTLARLIWHFVRVPDETRHWEAAVLVLLGSLLAMFLFNLMIFDRDLPYLRLGQPFILLAFALTFFSRNYELFRSTEQINNLLQRQLDAKTAALQEAHQRETALAREQAHDEERRRLMRDMHDGLGSHLMSMLVMARRGQADHNQYAEGIQQVIDEMRLMIDSLDSVGESLPKALASFRKSVSPRIAAAGFTLEWDDEVGKNNWPEYDPRTILQIFRILQEAVTNALKHSGGDRIAVTFRVAAGADTGVEMRIADNGRGLDTKATRIGGRGLGNMQARAASIGADIAWNDSREGMAMTVRVAKREHPAT